MSPNIPSFAGDEHRHIIVPYIIRETGNRAVVRFTQEVAVGVTVGLVVGTRVGEVVVGWAVGATLGLAVGESVAAGG